METVTRRSLIAGLGAIIAAPAIVRAGSLMPVKLVRLVEPSPFDAVVYSTVGEGAAPIVPTIHRIGVGQFVLRFPAGLKASETYAVILRSMEADTGCFVKERGKGYAKVQTFPLERGVISGPSTIPG